MLTLAGAIGVAALSIGPWHLGGVTFSVQTMLACAAAVVVGLQGLSLALVTRSYAAKLGVLPESAHLDAAIKRVTLNRGLAIGTLLALAGVVCFVAAVIRWGAADFGNLDPVRTIRWPILGMVLIAAGFQLIMVSFTLSLEEISGVGGGPPPLTDPLAHGHPADAREH